MFDVGFFSALLGGILTFFAPCTLPLIPSYIAFISGGDNRVGQAEGIGGMSMRRRTMLNALLFVFGFSIVFIAYGLVSGTIGHFLIIHRKLISQVGGLIVIYLGFSMLDFFRFPQLLFGGRLRLPRSISAGSRLGALALGSLFALGWSPCLGPILGTILLLAATGGTALYGGVLLAVYSLGLALPFLLIALLYGSTFSYLPTLERYLPLIQKAGGAMLVGIGLLLVLGQFGILNTWATEFIPPRLFNIMLQYT